MHDFTEIKLKRMYSNINEDIMRELIAPLLAVSVRYDRSVGFFSSTWLKQVAEGLAHFVKRDGKARIVTSIKLSERDWLAISSGPLSQNLEDFVNSLVINSLNELKAALEYFTLGALSWLIQNEIIEIRFAVPIGKLKGGIFHTKLAIFYDSNNHGVAISGSQNDSFQASLNEETVSTYTNWLHGNEYFEDHQLQFEQQWQGNNTTLKTFTLKETVCQKIIEIGEEYTGDFLKKHPKLMSPDIQQRQLYFPHVLRDYQKHAISAWFENGYRGMYEMATGTGKTITAISTAVKLFEEKGTLAVMVLVPYQHLVDQWADELALFGFQPLKCYGNSNQWKTRVSTELRAYRAKSCDVICLVATHTTAMRDVFKSLVRQSNLDWMVIGDEAHGLGASRFREGLMAASYRLGLSATPSRWHDSEGTEFLLSYFGPSVIQYGLKEAIDQGQLTPYRYEPVLIELDNLELAEYSKISFRIAQLMHFNNKDEIQEELTMLCLKRAKILGTASDKIPSLIELVKRHHEECLLKGQDYLHNLFYCSPGEHKEVLKRLSEIGIKVHEFVHSVSKKDRKHILQAFALGDIQGIVAIKCLDEGVDIPATRRAYIIASSTNPREFVQRRGRILRNYAGKLQAEVYDFIVGPWSLERGYDHNVAKSLLRRELPRFVEFSQLSKNWTHTITREDIRSPCEAFNMAHALYSKPWEVYDESKLSEVDLALDQRLAYNKL